LRVINLTTRITLIEQVSCIGDASASHVSAVRATTTSMKSPAAKTTHQEEEKNDQEDQWKNHKK